MGRHWIDEPVVLGSCNPTNEDLDELHHEGFRGIVSLLDEGEQAPCYSVPGAVERGFHRLSLPMADFSAPSLEQIRRFLRTVHQMLRYGKVLVHCQAGIGRTGTMGVAYWINRGLSAAEAIAGIRQDDFPALSSSQEKVLDLLEKEVHSGPPEPIDAVCFDFKGILVEGWDSRLFPEMIDLVEELRRRGVVMAVVSSADPWTVRDRLGPLRKAFDGIYHGSGGQKHHAIEEFVLAARLKDRSRVVFVDDSLENLVPAMERGPVYGIAFQRGIDDPRSREFCGRKGIPFAATPEELRRFLFSRP